MVKKKGKKILVIGYASINLGDDLFFKILFEKFPDHKFYLLAKKEYNLVFEHQNLSIIDDSLLYRFLWQYKRSLLFRILARKMDGCVIIGGSIFMENENSEVVFNYQNMIVNPFYKLNKKVFVLGPNFGPFQGQKFYAAYRKLFSKLEDICFRDSNSYELFSDLQNVRYAPDIVFSLNHPKRIKERRKQVGFSLIDIQNRHGLDQYHTSYISKIAELVQHFLQENYEVKLFSFCEREGDLQAITKVIETDPEIRNQVKIINYLGDIDTTLDEFQSCEIIIGTRFHSIILGLLFESHVVPIYYSKKTFNYLDDLGMGEFGFWMKDIEELTFERILNSKAETVSKVNVDESGNQFKVLDRFLNT